jgi:hypothetical protein
MSWMIKFKAYDRTINDVLWNGYMSYKRRYVFTNSVAPIFHICVATAAFGILVQNKTRGAREREHNLHEAGKKRVAEAEGREYVPSGAH